MVMRQMCSSEVRTVRDMSTLGQQLVRYHHASTKHRQRLSQYPDTHTRLGVYMRRGEAIML